MTERQGTALEKRQGGNALGVRIPVPPPQAAATQRVARELHDGVREWNSKAMRGMIQEFHNGTARWNSLAMQRTMQEFCSRVDGRTP